MSARGDFAVAEPGEAANDEFDATEIDRADGDLDVTELDKMKMINSNS